MTYTFKLSQRLARLRDFSVITACSLTLSCTASDDLAGPASPSSADPTTVAISPDTSLIGVGQTMQFQAAATTSGESSSMVLNGQRRGVYRKMVRLSVSPVSSTVVAAGTQTFKASALLSDGSTLVPPLTWTATGGSVDASGKYTAWTTPGKYHVTATASNGLADTAVVTISLTVPIVAQMVLSPATLTLSPGGSQQFFVEGKSADGATVGTSPAYTASGGSITPQGLYTAGSTPGTFQVIASDTASGKADTAMVTVAPLSPTLQAVVLTPASASLQAGTTQQFAATGRMSDGSTSSVSVTYAATGGMITSGGFYTAGSSAGSYRVIATVSGATLADTATVDIASPAPAPAPQPPAAPAGIPILPGQSIQAAVNANGRGTTFILKAGTHIRQSVVPKTGDTFWCETGTILDGQNATQYAFTRSGSDPDSVRIVGCIIQHYVPPAQSGAIQAGWAAPSDGTYGWIIDSTEVRNNANAGIRFGHHTTIRWSNVHDNGTIGITGIGDGVLVENTEIHHNNPTATALGFESGGTKFVMTHGLILRNNYVHDNKGPGLWLDIDNDQYLIENNTVDDNLQEGIVAEISYSGIIRNNTCRRNGLDDTRASSWPWGAGIAVAGSGGRGIEIYGNTLVGNAHGISLLQQNRGSGSLGPYLVQNVRVHDNTITLQTVPGHLLPGSLGSAEVADDVDGGIYTRNNVFTNNVYSLNGRTTPFHWQGYKTSAQWVSVGQDVNGTFVR